MNNLITFILLVSFSESLFAKISMLACRNVNKIENKMHYVTLELEDSFLNQGIYQITEITASNRLKYIYDVQNDSSLVQMEVIADEEGLFANELILNNLRQHALGNKTFYSFQLFIVGPKVRGNNIPSATEMINNITQKNRGALVISFFNQFGDRIGRSMYLAQHGYYNGCK